jgi:hypothetical protein
VIRFRGNIHVTDPEGTTKPAAKWVGKGGRAHPDSGFSQAATLTDCKQP